MPDSRDHAPQNKLNAYYVGLMNSVGYRSKDIAKPTIGIVNSWTEVNPGFKLTRGMLCAMRRPKLPTVEEVCSGARRISVLENVMNPTNIGAIFRSAAALNMDAVLLTPGCSNPLYRRAIRVSMGTEGDGLAAGTIADCDYTVRIPMSHGVDPLNVAAASAIAFWQLGGNE